MISIGEAVKPVLETIQRIRSADTTTNTTGSSKSSDCPHGCVDGFILDGWTATECVCLKQKKLDRLIKNAMIPEEFTEARFDSYRAVTPTQKGMLSKMLEYLDDFDQIKDQTDNSFGFIAVFGETRLREIRDPKRRSEIKQKHNNFGLGKTHLQVAAAKELIQRQVSVLIVSDVTLMDEMSRSKTYKDEGEEFYRLLRGVTKADVLVWDDIGKAKTTDARRDLYYQIINERYKSKKPIIFSSNEDQETLTERIGDAAASRLFGMAKGRVFAVEGQDYRLRNDAR